MKATGVMIVLLVLAACGQAQGSPTSSTSPVTSGPPLIAVLQAVGTVNPWTYNTVAIAGLDGGVKAKATFAPMPVPNTGCMGAIIPQSAHVAAGKVFYADAKGVIRSLSIDGTVATVATFPLTSTQQMLSFAVSPDGSKLLGTVYTIIKDNLACNGAPATAFSFDAYAATTGQASRLLYHESWTAPQNVLALTGWDALGPFGTDPTVWASQGGGPGSDLGVFVRVDATTLKLGAPFSDPGSCRVWNSVSSGAFVCTKDGVITNGGTAQQHVAVPVSVRRADGTELWHFTAMGLSGPSSPVLSPDMEHVIMCCSDVRSSLFIGRDGIQHDLAKGFYAYGWVDSTTMIGVSNMDPLKQPPFPMAYAAAGTPSTVIAGDLFGEFVGAVSA